jgi:beta-alanine--pyruvate transaminase
MLRITGDTIALSPPLIVKEEQIGEMFEDKLPKLLAAI